MADNLADGILEDVRSAFRDITATLVHQADEIEAIAEEKTRDGDLLGAQYAAGAAAGLRCVIRAFDGAGR